MKGLKTLTRMLFAVCLLLAVAVVVAGRQAKACDEPFQNDSPYPIDALSGTYESGSSVGPVGHSAVCINSSLFINAQVTEYVGCPVSYVSMSAGATMRPGSFGHPPQDYVWSEGASYNAFYGNTENDWLMTADCQCNPDGRFNFNRTYAC